MAGNNWIPRREFKKENAYVTPYGKVMHHWFFDRTEIKFSNVVPLYYLCTGKYKTCYYKVLLRTKRKQREIEELFKIIEDDKEEKVTVQLTDEANHSIIEDMIAEEEKKQKLEKEHMKGVANEDESEEMAKQNEMAFRWQKSLGLEGFEIDMEKMERDSGFFWRSCDSRRPKQTYIQKTYKCIQ